MYEANKKARFPNESRPPKLSADSGQFQTGHFLRKIPIHLPIKQVSWLADHSAPRLLTVQWLHSNGKGQADHSAIAQYYEHLTGIKLGRDL